MLKQLPLDAAKKSREIRYIPRGRASLHGLALREGVGQ
jgi:hypothetical protein